MAPRSQSFSASSARWDTNSSSSLSRVSTRSTTACFGSRTATKSAAWQRIPNYRKRNSRQRAMVTLRPNINAKSVPLTSMQWLRSSRAGNLQPPLCAARRNKTSSTKSPRMSLTSSPISAERGDLTDSRLAALCAETVRRAFATEGVDQAIEFVDTDFDEAPTTPLDNRRTYSGALIHELLIASLTDPATGFAGEHWCNLDASARLAGERIQAASRASQQQTPANGTPRFEVIGNIFYRGRGAYLGGLAFLGKGDQTPVAIALCLRHENETGIDLDAILIGETDLAILFSFTRAYFRVDTECPYELVRSLHQLMPRKRLIDLYNAIGYHRHGKTEFYRDFVRHLRTSSDRFVTAEVAHGMVMFVFTLPSYDVVFKLIKDRFDYPKENTRADVMRRYRLVFEHDRAGRLIEAHEFEHLRIPRNRFDPALLADLLRDASSMVRLESEDVVIAHTYVERRIRPLNLFLFEANEADVVAAGRDYGQSIKDLAASNIFPGDLLTKNFGVTRHGRVVFYDYDELCFLTDCNFRDLPQPSTHEEEMAAEPWFSVRENDIFPEEFLQFLRFPDQARASLLEQHADLFTSSFWRRMQQKLRAGEIPEVFPYNAERRLICGRGSRL